MNWIVLYIISFVVIVLNICLGYAFGNKANNVFETNSTHKLKSEITCENLIMLLLQNYNLSSFTAIVRQKSKKNNYFSLCFNAIKLSPTILDSTSVFSLSYGTLLSFKADYLKTNPICSFSKVILTSISRFIFVLFIPIILICSILNIIFGISKISFLIFLIFLCLYSAFLIIDILVYLLNISKINKIVTSLKVLNLFSDEDLKIIKLHIIACYKLDFFNDSATTFNFTKLLSPEIIFDRN